MSSPTLMGDSSCRRICVLFSLTAGRLNPATSTPVFSLDHHFSSYPYPISIDCLYCSAYTSVYCHHRRKARGDYRMVRLSSTTTPRMRTGRLIASWLVKNSGSYLGLMGCRVMPLSLKRTRLKVASSPLTKTAQSWPLSQVPWRRRISTSPSSYLGDMLSPLTFRAKYSAPLLNMDSGRSSQSSTSSTASMGTPAGIEPSTGMRR